MKALPRRIQLNVATSFPKSLRVFPDVCTLNGKNITGDEDLEPGVYILYIKRKGYKPINKRIIIAPGDMPYKINETFYPKLVQIHWRLTKDVSPEDLTIQPKIVLINENHNSRIVLNKVNKVNPCIYRLEIEMPGYEQKVTKESIMPSEDPYQISCRLTASMRNVVCHITTGYPPKSIVPDKITIDKKPVGKNFKIKPGVHQLVILKEGYFPVRKQIEVLASAKQFVLSENLKARGRSNSRTSKPNQYLKQIINNYKRYYLTVLKIIEKKLLR